MEPPQQSLAPGSQELVQPEMTRNDYWNAIIKSHVASPLHLGKAMQNCTFSTTLVSMILSDRRKWGKTIKLIHEIGFTDRRFKKNMAAALGHFLLHNLLLIVRHLWTKDSNWKLLWLVQSGALPVIRRVIRVMTPFIAGMGPSVSAKTPSFPPPPWLLQLLEPEGHA